MLIRIPAVLTKEELVQCRIAFAQSDWTDGKTTAGVQSAEAKYNLQVPEGSPQSRQLGEMILRALGRNPLFNAAALPLRVFPPAFGTIFDWSTSIIPLSGPTTYSSAS